MVLVVVPIIFALFLFYLIYAHKKAHRLWESYPTIDKYLCEHPERKTEQGIRCAKCGSGSIRNWGLNRASDSRRVFICNHCVEKLYRSS